MDDHRHWRYASLVFAFVLAAGMLVDGWPIYQSCRRKQREESVLIKQLHEIQQTVSLPALHVNHVKNVSLLKVMTDIAHVTGARLISMKQLSFENEKEVVSDRVSCVLNGSYHEILGVMTTLVNQSSGLLMRDFSITLIEQGDFTLQIDISMLNTYQVSYSYTATALPNPFCAGVDGQPKDKGSDWRRLRSVPVGLLQMTGYVKQGQRAVAWIRLPEGDVVQIERGDVIGREQASVSSITRNQVALMSAERKVMRILPIGGAHV